MSLKRARGRLCKTKRIMNGDGTFKVRKMTRQLLWLVRKIRTFAYRHR